jgi:hypothetical protein
VLFFCPQTKISKLEADRDEQAALRQVEVEHIKYTKDQQAKVGGHVVLWQDK